MTTSDRLAPTEQDSRALASSWVDVPTASHAGLFRVDSAEGTRLKDTRLTAAHQALVKMLAEVCIDQLEADVTQGKAPEPHHTNRREAAPKPRRRRGAS